MEGKRRGGSVRRSENRQVGGKDGGRGRKKRAKRRGGRAVVKEGEIMEGKWRLGEEKGRMEERKKRDIR